MKLYGALASPAVSRVVLAARAKGLELALEFPPGGLKSPEYLRINPLGKIPALEIDGRHLIESQSILEYLEDRFPEPALVPTDAHERYRVRLLCRLADLYVGPHLMTLLRNARPQGRDEQAVQAARAGLAQALDAVEQQGGEALARGPALTLADCALLSQVHLLTSRVAPAHGLDPFAGRPRLAAWWQRLQHDRHAGPLLQEIEVATQAFEKRMTAAAQASSASR